ncbi:3-keto-5-aminohexanoate cleavage protein [Streptomyces sp. NPDC092296]|uniref:3-keto-5-aminohexanoate cleavage protein n=1 Tax=Streptomyces sp. NPDC092296 TaxID=3366012 RepID=UPI0037FCD67E
MFLKAAINGGLTKRDHPGTPVTPEEIAAEALAAAEAGADVVHLHIRAADGSQSIAPPAVDAVLSAVRRVAPGVVVGITTGLWTSDGHADRYAKVATWNLLPDFASVAFCEEGAAETAELVVARGMVLESAVWSLADVPALLASPTLHRNVRILIEPEDEDPDTAVAHARAMAAQITAAGVTCPLLYHGFDTTVWPVLRASLDDGHQVRIGLEDGATLPDGSPAPGNLALIHAALALTPAPR